MKTKLFILLFFIVSISSSQEIETKFISTTPLHADTFIGVDEFDHIYYLKNNVLFKKSENDNINYSNVQLGKITSVNIQNPFKIVLFYKDFNSVIILDNKLNELTNRIDLTKETLFNNVELVSISSENDLWLYASDTKLYLYDYKNHFVKLQTQPMNFYHNGLEPKLIKSTYKNVWLIATDGVIQFNEYGNYIEFFKQKEITKFFPLKKRLVYCMDSSFYLLENNLSFPILLEYKKTMKDIYVNNTSIYIYDGSDIHKFNFL